MGLARRWRARQYGALGPGARVGRGTVITNRRHVFLGSNAILYEGCHILSDSGIFTLGVLSLFVAVYVRLPYLARRRPALLAAAREHGLELGLWFEAPVHPRRTNLAAVGYTGGNCPIAERTSQNIVNLPCHPGVSPADMARYVELLARVERG